MYIIYTRSRWSIEALWIYFNPLNIW